MTKKLIESSLEDLGLNKEEIIREMENYEDLGCYAIGSIYDTCECKKCRKEEEECMNQILTIEKFLCTTQNQ